jgi:uracil-DNA glycosylase
MIDARRHLVLKAPHPSPLSAHRGFIGCAHFSTANRYLAQHGQTPIDWSLPRRAELVA